jgi:hypothetical protein
MPLAKTSREGIVVISFATGSTFLSPKATCPLLKIGTNIGSKFIVHCSQAIFILVLPTKKS